VKDGNGKSAAMGWSVLHFMRGFVKFYEQCPTFYKIGYDLSRPRLITSGCTFKKT
jgi:hypothetical protein